MRICDTSCRPPETWRASLARILGGHLKGVDLSGVDWERLEPMASGLGHSDIVICGRNAVVDAVLDDRRVGTEDILREMRKRVGTP